MRAAMTLGRVRRSTRFEDRATAKRQWYEYGKRALDLLGVLILLLAATPLLVAVALLVRLETPGPTLFKHRRLGRHGRLFWCLKFRTMYVDAEARLSRDPELRQRFEERYKLDQDPRVTPLGHFLRRTSLDELPQFFNVLMGEMSLIGPRPIVPPEIEKYGEYGAELLTVTPGLGGLWQASGRSSITYEERVALDMAYIDHRSLVLDGWLLWQTAVAVLVLKGAR